MSEQKRTGAAGDRRPSDLPQDVLDVAHRVWLAGLGALASAQEGGDRLFRQLVDRGREMEGAGRETVRGAETKARATAENVRESARSAAVGVGDALDARVGSLLQRLGVPTRDEIQDLTRRVEDLNRKIERLHTAAPAPPPPAAARSAAKPAPKTTPKSAPKTATSPAPKPPAKTKAGSVEPVGAKRPSAAPTGRPKPPGAGGGRPGGDEGGA